MDSTRQQKVSRLIQRDLSDIFQKESVTMFHGALITVTVVRVAPDLSFAKVFVSIFTPKSTPKIVFETIQLQNKKIRNLLAQRVGKQLRIVPELAFVIDDSFEYQANIDKILNSK